VDGAEPGRAEEHLTLHWRRPRERLQGQMQAQSLIKRAHLGS
jgi:hypothetical protein